MAAVSIPHAAATAVRLWLLRRSIDRRVFQTFGVTSAAGGPFHGAREIPAPAAVAGALSGVLAGMVGNQGAIRSAAMLGFQVPRHAFVTATVMALIVDAARMPVYLATEARQILSIWPRLLGTVAGGQFLRRIPETLFRRLVSALVLGLGVFMLTRLGTLYLS